MVDDDARSLAIKDVKKELEQFLSKYLKIASHYLCPVPSRGCQPLSNQKERLGNQRCMSASYDVTLGWKLSLPPRKTTRAALPLPASSCQSPSHRNHDIFMTTHHEKQ